jgi:hypothetical protein
VNAACEQVTPQPAAVSGVSDHFKPLW